MSRPCHSHPIRQIAGLEAAVHPGSGCVQDIELAGRTAYGAEYLVAAPADDQKCLTSTIAIDGHARRSQMPR